MRYGRFEWITVPREAPPDPDSKAVAALPAKACPACGWVDADDRFRRLAGADAVSECWRCGFRFDLPMEMARFFEEENVAFPAVRVEIAPWKKKPFLAGSVSGSLDLLLRAEALTLRSGYDTLLAMADARIAHYRHQVRTATRVLRRMRGRALLADEVGLGKTVEAGLVIKELILRGEADSVLILSPAGLTHQWRREMAEKFDEDFTVVRGKSLPEDARRIIVSYDTAKRRKAVGDRFWDVLVMDEAHRLKNRGTALNRFVRGLGSRYALALTATPVMNTLTELFAIADLVDPGRLGTLRSFKRAYGDPRRPQSVKAGAEGPLREALAGVMIRNRRDTCGVHFPRRRAGIYALASSAPEAALYRDVTAYVRKEYKKAVMEQTGQRVRALSLMVLQRELMSSPEALMATLARIREKDSLPEEVRRSLDRFARCAEAIDAPSKLRALEELLKSFADRRFVIFTEFLRTQAAIVRYLKRLGIEAFAMSGRLSPAARARVVDAAKTTPGSILVSTESGGTGLNLQFCDALINYDLPWNPMKVEQRIGRIDRIGQTKETLVFNMVCRDTIEAYVVDVLIRKLRMFESVIGETGTILGPVSEGRSFERSVADIWLGSDTDQEACRRGARLADAVDGARQAYDRGRRCNAVFDRVGVKP